MQTLFITSQKGSLFLSTKQKVSLGKMLSLIVATLFLIANIASGQSTCITAVNFIPTNASTCTPGTAFNCNAVGTGPAFTSCGTGVASPLNVWGRFVAYSSTASISYDPPNNRDAMIFAYSGSCPVPTQIGCVNAGTNDVIETLNLTGLTPGTTYFFRIVAYNRGIGNMNGTVCVASPYTITTGTISGTPLCAATSVSVPFTSSGSFSSNTYSAHLSDPSGSFSSPTNIGTLVSSANSGTINTTIPAGTVYGTGYRIRVVSNSPTVIGTNNGTDITINSRPQGTFSGNTVCGTGTAELTFTATSGTGPFTVIYNDGIFNRTKTGVVSGTAFTPFITPLITSNYTLQSVTDANGCVRSTGFTNGNATITISSTPTIASASAASTICYNANTQNSNINYSLTTGTPTQYSITWDASALSAGLVNISNIAITSSPLNIPVAANAAAGSHTGSLTVTNAAGCNSSGNSFTLTINPSPTISLASSALSKCFSSSYQNGIITYSTTTNSPINYSIVWDAAALSAGLTNVTNATLGGSPLVFPIPAGTGAGTHNGTLTVTAANSCSSGANAFTQQLVALPTITSSATATSLCFSSGSQTSTLSYSATTGSPTLYTITWDAAALSAGLVNVSATSLPATPINIPVSAGVAGGTYNGTLRVLNGFGCQSSPGNVFTLTITSAGALPAMTSASSASVCTGAIVNIPLTSNIPSTYTWIATSNANVSGESTTLQTTSTLNNTLTIASGGTQTVNYTVTPTSTSGCPGTPQTVVVTVNPLPTITTSATAATRCYNTSAQTSTLSFSATTNSPTRYNIIWNAAALSAGLVNTGTVSLPASSAIFSIPAGVAAATYTGTLTVANANGCNSTGNPFTVTITAAPSITSQPVSRTVCSGTSTTFSVTASGTSLSYQWRKGTTNLCNCANISGVNTPTLTINPVGTGDAASNYNCVIVSSGCANVISDFATLTVTTAASAPTALPKDLVFPTVATTSILASFTYSTDATNYLVVRKTTNVAPTNPSNGTTYTINSTILTGTVDYVGTNTSFTSNGLTPGTTYYYWVFPYNTSSCGTSPLYLTSTPLTGSVTTATNVACGTVTTLYWGGTGSALTGRVTGTDFNTASNWSTSSTSYIASPASPTQCNNVSLALTSSATITLSGTTDIYGLNFTVSGNGRIAKLSTEGNTLTVNSDAVIDVLSGNNTTNIYIGENGSGAGIIDFKANFKIGETYFNNVPYSYLIGNVNSKIIFRGDVLFGRTAAFILPGQTVANAGYPPSYPLTAPGAGTTPGTLEFDGLGLQQVLWNNNVWYDCFYNIVVGNQNKPYVKHVTGTYTPDNILNDFTINDGCTVDLGVSQWIREQPGGTFTMNGSAKLIMGNNLSVRSSANTGVRVTGSNFPGGFSTMNISPTSTIEYNGNNSLTQTVYATPTYGNLILSNIDGTGIANKISTGTVTISGAATVSDKTTFIPGTGVVVDGTASVNSGGTWVAGTNVVSGAGTFNLLSGGTLTIASTAGITSSGATGNIQTFARSFSTGGNYTYNASSAQATGNGLPTTMNNLTILNSSGVTMHAASANYTIAGTLALTSGPLAINGDSLTINNLTRTSGTLTGSTTSSVGITGTSVPLFFTSGGRILKNLFVNTNGSADLQTPLDITAGSSAGSVAVGSGSTLTTYSYLTLKSDANGTARVAEIPVDGSGNALGNITGDVVIERYIPGRRSWRMVTAPVQASGSQTINEAWQEGVVNTDITNNQNPNPGFGVHISGSGSASGFDVTPFNNPSLKVFTRSSSAWVGIANTVSTYVRDYEGYMLFARGSRSTNLSQNTGAALSNTVIRENGGLRMGRQTVSLPGGTGSYSVVGNPYPSTIDFRTLNISGGGNIKTFVMWDPALTGIAGVGAYQYFTRVAGPGSDYTVFPGGGSYGVSGTINSYVQSGQAFLVTNSSAATLTIEEASKASSSTSNVFRPMPDNITGKISTILYGFEADSSMIVLDGGLTLYRSEFEDSLDQYDVKKLSNLSSENFGITKGATVYQIEMKQSINENDTIHYSMRNLKARKYQLEVDLKNIEATGMTAFLKDNYTGTVTTLDYNNPYSLTFTPTNAAPGSYAADRFKIYFKQLNVLPVTFTSLEAVRKNNNINVEWRVQNETNIKHYEVERSTDGVNFSKLNTDVQANNSNQYQLVDEHPQYGLNYFRVKAIEKNGRSKYTNIAKVFFGKTATGIAVFPNPVSDEKINLYLAGEQAGDYTINLFNSAGQLIKTVKLVQLNGNGNASIEMDKKLSLGNYILEIVKPDHSKQHINIVN